MPAIIAMMPIFRPINFPSTFDHHIGRSREPALQPASTCTNVVTTWPKS